MSAPRLYCEHLLSTGLALTLPAAAARHVQVLRLQPGDPIALFDGAGGTYQATITAMGRKDVTADVGAFDPTEREAARSVHLAVGVPANDRMDWLIEKATELGVASIQALQTERSVVKLSADRAAKRVEHWQGVAIAACEQSRRSRIPNIGGPIGLESWLKTLNNGSTANIDKHWLLSFREDAIPVSTCLSALGPHASCRILSGPEGGLSEREETMAVAAGFVPVSLGPRVLRADTAPLAALASLVLT
jgi:16S rRNA (uracil1498-N3)-methyltransferase